jgi:hypothetical protein
MKYILLLSVLILELFSAVVESPIVALNENTATIHIEKIDVGMSGFIVHKLTQNHSTILNNIVVTSFDKSTKTATLELSDFSGLRNNSLPSGKWHVEVGDMAILAFGYTRGFLVAPSEEIYHRVTKATQHLQWIHPDIFATILSFNGHPTPLKEDFENLSDATSVGLLFFYLDKRLFTLDAKSFKILNISDADLLQDTTQLPFYTRVTKIDAAWWGEGSNELEDYEPHYYELMLAYNKNNLELQEIIRNADKKLHFLVEKFETKE